MKSNLLYRSRRVILLPIVILFFLLGCSQGQSIHEKSHYQSNSAIEYKKTSLTDSFLVDHKQKGAHVYGRVDTTNFQILTRNNIEWVTLITWAGQADYDSPILKDHNGDSLRLRRSDSSWISQIELFHAAGFKVFVKPHIWLNSPSNGKWRSDIYPANEEDWELWKKSYCDYIFRYAKIAEHTHAEMLCIGTELSRLTVEKPDFWRHLIKEVRSIYSGKITYAANWHNEYEKITFWEELDFIGVQAYFPLVKDKFPNIEQISKGWTDYLPDLESIHQKYNRKILFTELGYKSTADCAIKPWEWAENSTNEDKNISPETQANCYQAFFNTVWKKEWFAGVHFWYLRGDYVDAAVRKDNFGFSPQGKQAEGIIAEGFAE